MAKLLGMIAPRLEGKQKKKHQCASDAILKTKQARNENVFEKCVQKKRINYNLVCAERSQKSLSELTLTPSLLTFKNGLFIQNHMVYPGQIFPLS